MEAHFESSSLDQIGAVSLQCQTGCPTRPTQVKLERLSGDTVSEWNRKIPGVPIREARPSMSSTSSSGMDATADPMVNVGIGNKDDSSDFNFGIEIEDVSFADMMETDQYYGDYDLFNSFMNDIQNTAAEEDTCDKDGSSSNRVLGDNSGSPSDSSICANNSMTEITSDEESVRLDRDNIPGCTKPLDETQHPVTRALRPRLLRVTATKSKTISATSYEQHPLSDSKQYGTMQQSCGDIRISRNAQQARITRQRKKAYIKGLGSKVTDMHKENTKLKSETVNLRRDKRLLEEEVLYLKRVLANDSALASLLQNIDHDGVTLSKSFENQRKRSLALDHDYGKLTSKYQRTGPINDTRVKQTSSGICLHVDTGRVSLEFCSKCACLANNVTDDED